MFWDIALPTLAALAQVVTGFLGWRVTVDGVRQERKKLYERLFALSSMVGVLAVGIAAYRGSQISGDLSELKKGQQTANSGIQAIKNNPPIVNVTPPTVNVPAPPVPMQAASIALDHVTSGHVEAVNGIQTGRPIWLVQDQVIDVNLFFRNSGPVIADCKKEWGRIYLVPSDPTVADVTKNQEKVELMKVLVPRVKKALRAATQPMSGIFPANGQGGLWLTVHSENVITQDDIAKLHSGAELLFLFYDIEYTDPIGPHYIHSCQIAQTPAFDPEIWQVCPGFQDHK